MSNINLATAMNMPDGTKVYFEDSTVRDMISDEYDNTETYAKGVYCRNDNTLYKCTTAIATPEVWTPAHWNATDVGSEVSALSQSLAQKQNHYIDNSNASTYTIPISAINQNHSFGVALVGAWKELYLLFFVAEANNCTITKLSNVSGQTCSISNTTTDITLTFSSTVWAGITVMPL